MTSQPSGSESDATQLEDFILKCQQGLRHQVQGQSEPFLEVWSHADDVVILGAIGGYALGWKEVKNHLLGAAKTLDWTSVSVETIVTTVADGLAVSVVLEQMTREVDGETQARTVRVTHAYRREYGEWRHILRHANRVTPEDESRERSLLAGDPD